MNRKIVLSLALAILVVASVPVVADGGQTFAGQTTFGSHQYLRTSTSGTATGTSVRYQTQTFYLPSATTCYFYGQQEFDGFLSLYRTSFNPLSPTTNWVASNDDGDLSIGTSHLEDLALTAGTYILVNSAFSSGFGTFTTTIHCENDTPPLGVPCNGYVIGNPIPNENGVCLNGRFLVWIDNVSNSSSGLGNPVRFGSSDTGIFWFFSPTNYELMIKVLNGCGINNRYWVYGAGLTDQAHRIRVFDTEHPAAGIKSYSRNQGSPAPAITDSSAFATCP